MLVADSQADASTSSRIASLTSSVPVPLSRPPAATPLHTTTKLTLSQLSVSPQRERRAQGVESAEKLTPSRPSEVSILEDLAAHAQLLSSVRDKRRFEFPVSTPTPRKQ